MGRSVDLKNPVFEDRGDKVVQSLRPIILWTVFVEDHGLNFVENHLSSAEVVILELNSLNIVLLR